MGHQDDELHSLLIALADDAVARYVVPPGGAGMARNAARRGRRRLRARAAQQVTAALLAAGVVAGVAALPPNVRKPWLWHTAVSDLSQDFRGGERSAGYDPYRRYLDLPTRGPLAGDEDFLDRARRAWESGSRDTEMASRGVFDDLRGDPHVVWAGQTPAGPAAVVVQPAVLHVHDGLPAEDAGPKVLIGYVATGDRGDLRVVAADYGSYPGAGAPPNGQMIAAWADVSRRILLVLDPGYRVGFSERWTYTADGGARRTWTFVEFSDGVTVLDLPDDVDPTQVRVARQPPEGFSAVARVGAQPAIRVPAVVGWWPEHPCLRVSGSGPCGPEHVVLTEARERRTDAGDQNSGATGTVAGTTPDGRAFAVAGMSVDGDRPRVLGLVFGRRGADGSEELVDAGALDAAAALPYAVRLPDGQGWVVARHGARFRYRLGAGEPWRVARPDAALLPDAGTLQVEVTPRGAAPVVVQLGH